MPKMNGIKASQQVREKFPDVKILMLSMHNNRELITESLKAGANGYVLNDCVIFQRTGYIFNLYEEVVHGIILPLYFLFFLAI